MAKPLSPREVLTLGSRPSPGVTGFCAGGALTLHTTAEYPMTAAVPWCGHVKRTYPDAPGVDAFSVVSRIKAPVLGLYGGADTGIAPEDVKRFEAELRKTNPSVDRNLKG